MNDEESLETILTTAGSNLRLKAKPANPSLGSISSTTTSISSVSPVTTLALDSTLGISPPEPAGFPDVSMSMATWLT